MLADALVLVLLGSLEPTLKDGKVFGGDVKESDAGAEVGLDVDDFGLGLKDDVAGGDFDEDEGLRRERIHHVQIAAVEAEFADAGGDADVGFLLDELCRGDEGVAGYPALLFH